MPIRRRRSFTALALALAMPVLGASAASASPVTTDSAVAVHLVGLGDSVESGYNCDCDSFVDTAATAIATAQGKTPVVDNDAVAGFTTEDVLEQLSDSVVRAQIGDSDIVVIEIGANDLDEQRAYDETCLSDLSKCYAGGHDDRRAAS